MFKSQPALKIEWRDPMTRRDQNVSSQQPGGYRNEDAWDSPRQASQWSESGRQAGGSWDHDDNERTAYWNEDDQRNRSRDSDSRSEARAYGAGSRDWQDRDYGGESPGARSREDEFRGSSRDLGSHGHNAGRYDNDWDRQRGGRGDFRNDYSRSAYSGSGVRNDDRRYASRGTAHLPHTYDASGGNDFASFTSEDFGGRDFSANRGGGISGGQHPSDTYRPSFGLSREDWLGSSTRDRGNNREDYGSWRQYGESRGFLDRAGDEIASWFGDEDAARRREQDHRGRGPSDYTRSDERIREDINDRLTHDGRVDATHIRVTVKDGEVSLDGTIGNRAAKRRAEDVADEISGVRHVQNNLRVQDASQSRSYGAQGSGSSALSTGGLNTGGLPTGGTSGSLGGTATGTSQSIGQNTTGQNTTGQPTAGQPTGARTEKTS